MLFKLLWLLGKSCKHGENGARDVLVNVDKHSKTFYLNIWRRPPPGNQLIASNMSSSDTINQTNLFLTQYIWYLKVSPTCVCDFLAVTWTCPSTGRALCRQYPGGRCPDTYNPLTAGYSGSPPLVLPNHRLPYSRKKKPQLVSTLLVLS